MINNICNCCNEEKDVVMVNIISKKVQPGMKSCIYNKMFLCSACHNKYKGEDKDLEKHFKLNLQKMLFSILDLEILTVYEIEEALKIKEVDVKKIIKLIHPVKVYKYSREDVVRACMGGKLMLDGGDGIESRGDIK